MADRAGRFFRFSYLRQDVKGTPQIHELRDGHAFVELAAVLYASARPYGGILLNYPTPDTRTAPILSPSDLLVMTTRPPVTDNDFDSRPIRRSDSLLEKAILHVVGQTFPVCRRGNLRLSESIAKLLEPAYRNRAEMEFTVNGPVRYKRYRMPYTKNRTEREWHVEPTDSFRTPAFLLFTRVPDGPMLLNAFAMDGPRTLIWCYLLRTRFPHLLESPRFVLAEMFPRTPVPARPSSLLFADHWPVEILLNHPLE